MFSCVNRMFFSDVKIRCILIMTMPFVSCRMYDPPDTIPAYVRITGMEVIIDTPSQGTGSHGITDAWVYVDNNLAGAFELPALVPVIASGSHTLTLRPGIKASGFTDLRVRYPFYEPYVAEFVFHPDSIHDINADIHYYSDTKFLWAENFESPAISLVANPALPGLLTVTNDASLVFEGTKSGVIQLNSSQKSFECLSGGDGTPFTPKGTVTYLEMNYRTAVVITVGVYAYSASATVQAGVINLYPSSVWNKIYIDLSGTISGYPSANGFNVYFYGSLPDSLADAEVYFDNIKILN